MISYEGLEEVLKEKRIGKSKLGLETGLSSRTIAKIAKGEKLSGKSLQRIADYLDILPERLMREISDNSILQRLRDEKDMKLPGGLYHELQIRMTYNSNHIEGSMLSEEQTRHIFETNTLDVGEGIPVAVGDYKKRANMVGGRETSKPAEVPRHMACLIAEYNARESVTMEDIVAFHAEFEYIHPFQDGNGRVGRLVALKECLRHNIIPFIIEDAKKNYYYRGLAEWRSERGWLRDTCLDGQDSFIRLLDMLEIPHA